MRLHDLPKETLPTPRPWREAIGWMVFLAPFFFLVYGSLNTFTAGRRDVGVFVFGWERAIPFWPFLITPYMSIDIFFGFSVLLAKTKAELRVHCYRIIAAIVLAALGFLLFPLRYSFDRPPVSGWNGMLFELLGSFDQPFNQAPSLHVALLAILWAIYGRHIARIATRGWRLLAAFMLHGWFALIGLSIVTVHQHHFIDFITGAALAVACFYLFPWPRSARIDEAPVGARRRVLALGYAGGAVLVAMAAVACGRGGQLLMALLLAWPALALATIAAGYARFGAQIFQKHDGVLSFPARVVLAPYRFGAWLSYRWHVRGQRPFVEVAPNVLLGRMVNAADAHRLRVQGVTAVLDLTPEFGETPSLARSRYLNLPWIDLVAPSVTGLGIAARFINTERADGVVFVHCAIGRSRSVCAVAAALIESGEASTVEAAITRLRRFLPGLVLYAEHRAALERLVTHPQAARALRS